MIWRFDTAMLLGLIVVTGCDVPVRRLDTGGTDLGEGGAGGAGGACGRGFVVVESDYQSTNVSLLDSAGSVLSPSFISSASSSAGLSAALSGDVVLPSGSMRGDHIVLIDRYPAAVLTWVEIQTARVTAQLSVATGFAANPRDYVEVSPTKAYVPRFAPNLEPGRQSFDAGSDLLVVDPSVPEITKSIDLRPALADVADRFFPSPERALRLDDRVVVVLGAYRMDLCETAPSRLVVIDAVTDEVVQWLDLDGFHACWSLALSPAGDELAVACAGEWGCDNSSDLASSGVVRVRVADELTVVRSHPATELGEGPVAVGMAYGSARHLLVTTYGQFEGLGGSARDDALVELDLETSESRAVLRSLDEPFTFGDVSCDSICGACFLADASREGGVVHRFAVGSDGAGASTSVRVENDIGLPPRGLGRF